MPFIPVPNVAQVRMVYLHLGETCVNNFHVYFSGGWDADRLEDLADTFLSWHDIRLQPNQSTATALLRVEARDLTVEDGEGVSRDCVSGCVGLSAGPAAPGNVTACVTCTTGHVGRSRRGRTYHIGMTDDMTSGNNILEATRLNLEAAYLDLLSDLATANSQWVLSVVSYYEDGQPRPVGLVTEIRNATVDPYLDSMRTRLPGRGT